MDKDTIDEVALVMLVESNWQEFVEYSGGEESAGAQKSRRYGIDTKTGAAAVMWRPLQQIQGRRQYEH